MAWRLMPHGAQDVGDGPSPRRQEGAKQEDKESIEGGSGKRQIPPDLVVKSQAVDSTEGI
jgi:hypothetical protein